MKREVDCIECGEKWALQGMGKGTTYPGEGMIRHSGFALRNMMCDGCGKTLPAGEPAMCVSVWGPHGIQYFEWETEYIQLATTKELDAFRRLDGDGPA